MAELSIFHYLPQKSVIHGMDSRLKLIAMILLSGTAGIAARVEDLAILSSFLLVALIGSKLPAKRLFAELKNFLFVIGMIILVHSFSVPGAPLTGIPIPGLTREGLWSGILFGWRITLIILACAILTGTTALSSLKSAVEWFLRPIPFIREARVGTMFSLTFVLIPLIFDQAAGILDAQKARCIEGRKNPIQRIVFLVFPFLLQTFRRADEMALAMESRCYSEDRTPVVFKTKFNDWMLLIFTELVCILIVLRSS